MELRYRAGDREVVVELSRDGDAVTATVDGRPVSMRVMGCADGRLALEIDGARRLVRYARTRDAIELAMGGRHLSVAPAESEYGAAGGGGGTSDGQIRTPMPGTVVAVKVSAGDTVAKGDTLLVLESMKMQNDIDAPFDGVVSAVHHAEGDSVEFGDMLVEVDPADAS